MVQTKSQKANIDTPTAASSLSEASPRPWRVGYTDGSGASDENGYCISCDGGHACVIQSGDSFGLMYGTDNAADAALIVRAVNNFDALVNLIDEILTDELCNKGAPPGVGWFDRAEKLLNSIRSNP